MSEIFFGSGLEKNEKHATRPPVGEKFNIKTITPPMIAYTATQVSVVFKSIFSSLTAFLHPGSFRSQLHNFMGDWWWFIFI